MEKSGLVCTSLKLPNSGWPNSAKPWLERARRITCSKPICLRGQPSALANGSHIAITSGVRTIDGLSSGASGRSASKLSSRPQSEEAGDQITGSSCPSAMRRSASPLDTTSPSTKASPSSRLNSRISGTSSFSFSGE